MNIETVTLKDSERTRVECWSRVMGYHRPTMFFNTGKQQEHKDRKMFREDRTTLPDFRDSWPKSQPPGIDFKFKFTRA